MQPIIDYTARYKSKSEEIAAYKHELKVLEKYIGELIRRMEAIHQHIQTLKNERL